MKQFVIIGLGRFGSSLACKLTESGYDVLGIDIDKAKVQNISNMVPHVVEADATNKKPLYALGIEKFDIGIVSIGNVHANIFATQLLKECGVSNVIAKAHDELHGKVLSKIGADTVIFPEREMGKRLAQELISPTILDYLKITSDYSVVEIIATDKMAGKSLKELDLRNKYKVNVIAIKSKENLNLTPEANYIVFKKDILIVIGKNSNLVNIKGL